MLYRCESCQTVQVAPKCQCGHVARALTTEEAEAYVQQGHAAFGDLVAVTDEQGGVMRYDRR